MLNRLLTPHGEALLHSGETPWNVHPKPQMKRDSWINLNGKWEFSAADFTGEINVPFCPESILSGVEKHFPEGSQLRYRRIFTLPEGFDRGRVLLHIGAADQHAEVSLNGRELCRHSGGYEAFTVDITEALQEENELVICCRDDLNDQAQPSGRVKMRR